MTRIIIHGNELYHHGILGQKWGLRRWQNEDGSLTPEGRAHYGIDQYKRAPEGGSIRRQINVEKAKNRLTLAKGSEQRKKAKDELKKAKNELKVGQKEYAKFEKDMHKAYGKYNNYIPDPDNNNVYTNKKNGTKIKDYEYQGLVDYALNKEVKKIVTKNRIATGLGIASLYMVSPLGDLTVNAISKKIGK